MIGKKLLILGLFFILASGLVQSQTIIESYFPEEDYEIRKDTSFSSDFKFSWIEKSIPDSYISFDYEDGGQISRRYHRNVQITFFINDDSVVSIRKEMFQDLAGFDYQSIFRLFGVFNVELLKKGQEVVLLTFFLGKPDTDYLFYVDLFISKSGAFRYELRNPEHDDAY